MLEAIFSTWVEYRKITVNVTKRHINLGIKGDCLHCPVAIAVNERLMIRYRVSVKETITIKEFGTNKIVSEQMLPHDVHRFMYSFDRAMRRKVRPFQFELWLPRTCVSLVKRKWVYKCLTNGYA